MSFDLIRGWTEGHAHIDIGGSFVAIEIVRPRETTPLAAKYVLEPKATKLCEEAEIRIRDSAYQIILNSVRRSNKKLKPLLTLDHIYRSAPNCLRAIQDTGQFFGDT